MFELSIGIETSLLQWHSHHEHRHRIVLYRIASVVTGSENGGGLKFARLPTQKNLAGVSECE